MTLSTLSTANELGCDPALLGISSQPAPASAVSWGAIVAGATGAAALSLILLMLGTGLGLSSISPWAYNGVSATTLGVSTILWLTFTQLLASGMGGYLAGRLRTRWLGAQLDEVYFRDTAHGFLSWAIAALATAALLTSVIGSIVNGGIQAQTAMANTTAVATENFNNNNEPLSYFVDSLFRKNSNAIENNVILLTTSAEASTTAHEVTHIFINSLRAKTLPPEDVRYVGQLVVQRTGLTQQNAEKRVLDIYTRAQTRLRDTETSAKEIADKTRKASATAALWLFISLLIGAFVASVAAIYGGRQRDMN